MVSKSKNILAFDLDGIFIDKPPIIPKKLLEYLFRGCKKNGLCFRFPSTKVEQLIRQLSHFYLLRPPIVQNIQTLQKLSRQKKYYLYLISSRYSFLNSATHQWLNKRKITRCFSKILLNSNNQQPHIFKENQLKTIKPNIYFEDDKHIADYLTSKLKKTKIIYLKRGENIYQFLQNLANE